MTNLNVKVDYYDSDERAKIMNNFPYDFPLIENIAGKTITISYDDFKIYSVFGFQYNGTQQYRTFIDLSEVAHNIYRLETLLRYNPELESLVYRDTNRPINSSISEELGIAGGLSIASEIYSLTQADWQSIPIAGHKDFDFSIAATNYRRYVCIEAKGSITDRNEIKSPGVSEHKRKIIGKKSDSQFKAKYDYAVDSCLGIITVADSHKPLQAWIVDPIFDSPSISPEVFKLLKREYYYFLIISSIVPQSIITTALANRYNVLATVRNFEGLDRLPLLKYNMEKIGLEPSFFQVRTTDLSGEILGRLFITHEYLIFIGLRTSCFLMLINQNFQDIREFAVTPSTRKIILNGIVSKSHKNTVEKLNMDGRITNLLEKGNKLFFDIRMDVVEGSSGMSFAYLHL